MASAVLASRNEPYWGESKVYMRKYTNNTTNNPNLSKFNPNPNPNPNPNSNSNSDSVSVRQSHDFQGKARVWQRNEPPQPKVAPPAAALDRSLSLNRRAINVNGGREWSYGEYVSFNLAENSRAELKEIKKRLISDLEQVRSLRARIETREIESRSSYPVPGFSGGYGGRDVRPLTRPPPLQISYAVGSNGAIASQEKRTPKAKSKKVSGNKRGRHFSSGRDPKQHTAAAVSDAPVDKVVFGMLRRCKQMLTKLMKHKHSWVFNAPVDTVKLGLHDYHLIIKHPMDLGTVKSKLDKNEYGSPMDFASDVRLTFNNALTYNLKGHDVYIMADTLLQRFEEMFNPAFKKFEAEHHRMVAAEKTNQMAWSVQPTLSNPISVQPTLSNPPLLESENPRLMPPKLPKPKAKDLNKRNMNFEEKAKLGMNLQNLPQEKMDQLLQIIKRRNPRLEQEGDEIELDIEALDTETLWELDRFANYHKKAVTKLMRQGLPLLDNSISEVQTNELPVNEPMPEAMVQKNKKVDFGEEDVDIGEEIPMNNFPPLEIEKDYGNGSSRSSSSSSSSSSGGSSTSSDSGSGSSSGSDSDDDVGESKEAAEKTIDGVGKH